MKKRKLRREVQKKWPNVAAEKGNGELGHVEMADVGLRGWL